MSHGIFFSNTPDYWKTMVSDVCASLSRVNFSCEPIEPSRPENVLPLLEDAASRSPDFVASFNFRISWSNDLKVSEIKWVFPHGYIDATPIIIFLDNPIHEFASIGAFEHFSNNRHHIAAPIYGVMDADHKVFMSDQGIPPERVILFPQGGPPISQNPLRMDSRPIDIIFHGSIADLETDAEFFARIGMADTSARLIMNDAIELVLSDKDDPYIAAKTVLSRFGYNAPEAAAKMAVDIDLRARRMRRWRILSNLRELEIHFCGNVCDAFRRSNPNGIYHGQVSFTEVTNLVRHSKIMINETINLRHAALMRLHYAMADGCVVATQKNLGLMENFSDGHDIVFLTGTPGDVPKLQDLVADIPTLQAISDRALKTHAAAHQWDHRLGPFLDAIA